MTTAGNDMITLAGVTKTFNAEGPHPVRALDALSIAVKAGEFVVVIGSNGSGKSTLLNAIAGTVLPDAGTITINGADVTRTPAHRRARVVGRVFQNPLGGTAASMTVAENLRLAALRGQPKRWRIGLTHAVEQELAERARLLGMGLETRMHTPIGLLSGGQRQALTLLMATLGDAHVLLLDEHTAALDPASAEQIMVLTETLLARRAIAALMVTHDMIEAVRHGTRLLMMHAGRIAYDVAGDDKKALTPPMLMERFASLRASASLPDDWNRIPT